MSDSKKFIVAVDCDGMLFSFPEFFAHFFNAMQASGSSVGVLTARPDDQKEAILDALEKIGIKPSFFVGLPKDIEGKEISHGLFKAKVCNELEVDLLFDDFQTSDNAMLADFFSNNQKTVPFTSWAYTPDAHKNK